MKATEIKMQVVKNIGNYETVRFEVTYALDSENVSDAFAFAKKELDSVVSNMYSKNVSDKILVDIDSDTFSKICTELRSGRYSKSRKQSFEKLKDFYTFTDSCINYLTNEKLI